MYKNGIETIYSSTDEYAKLGDGLYFVVLYTLLLVALFFFLKRKVNIIVSIIVPVILYVICFYIFLFLKMSYPDLFMLLDYLSLLIMILLFYSYSYKKYVEEKIIDYN